MYIGSLKNGLYIIINIIIKNHNNIKNIIFIENLNFLFGNVLVIYINKIKIPFIIIIETIKLISDSSKFQFILININNSINIINNIERGLFNKGSIIIILIKILMIQRIVYIKILILEIKEKIIFSEVLKKNFIFDLQNQYFI